MAIVVFAGGLLIGYGARMVPLTAQSRDAEFLPFTAGQTVRLQVDLPEGGRRCIVTQVLNGFIGCGSGENSTPRWINLRNVQEITPVSDR